MTESSLQAKEMFIRRNSFLKQNSRKTQFHRIVTYQYYEFSPPLPTANGNFKGGGGLYPAYCFLPGLCAILNFLNEIEYFKTSVDCKFGWEQLPSFKCEWLFSSYFISKKLK